MNRHRIDKVPKCGSVDSKYSSRPNAFDEDVKRHREEYKSKCDSAYKMLDDFINQSTNQSENLSIVIQECIKLKEKYRL
ncbi:hypothetical protein GCM10008908_24520 [Clostridium subterminale]|uniref:Uncharacterized protein n=1 Tax=Clostridium subterminale TaxID=1550 RepID=A0ABN1KRY4_CLOSU